jgi:hypothetical protein
MDFETANLQRSVHKDWVAIVIGLTADLRQTAVAPDFVIVVLVHARGIEGERHLPVSVGVDDHLIALPGHDEVVLADALAIQPRREMPAARRLVHADCPGRRRTQGQTQHHCRVYVPHTLKYGASPPTDARRHREAAIIAGALATSGT